MINALDRLGSRVLRGVLPKAEAQACVYEWNDCTNVTVIGNGETEGDCLNSCKQRVCTVDYYGTLLGC